MVLLEYLEIQELVYLVQKDCQELMDSQARRDILESLAGTGIQDHQEIMVYGEFGVMLESLDDLPLAFSVRKEDLENLVFQD
jgi:hypothetical protein